MLLAAWLVVSSATEVVEAAAEVEVSSSATEVLEAAWLVDSSSAADVEEAA